MNVTLFGTVIIMIGICFAASLVGFGAASGVYIARKFWGEK